MRNIDIWNHFKVSSSCSPVWKVASSIYIGSFSNNIITEVYVYVDIGQITHRPEILQLITSL